MALRSSVFHGRMGGGGGGGDTLKQMSLAVYFLYVQVSRKRDRLETQSTYKRHRLLDSIVSDISYV